MAAAMTVGLWRVADLVLDDKYRPHAALLAADDRAQVRVKDFSSVHFHLLALPVSCL